MQPIACVFVALVALTQFIVPRATAVVSAPVVETESTACADAATGGTIRYVNASAVGSNNGTSWANAWTSLVTAEANVSRGQTLCVADGSYAFTTFNVANSGTSTITIKKATTGDHGSATGWVSTMGDGQAVLAGLMMSTDYWIIDGGVRNADWYTGAVSQYGIKINGNARLDEAGGVGTDHSTFKYVDFYGGGQDSCDGTDNIYGLYGNSQDTFQRVAIHDSDRTNFLMRGSWDDFTLEYSYIARNTSRPTQGGGHGEMISMTDGNRWIIRYNVIEDTEGTAGMFAALNNGALADVKVYGNTIAYTANYGVGRGLCTGEAHNSGWSALIYVAWDASQHNSISGLKFYNNTIHQNVAGASGIHIDSGGDLGGTDVQNNIWYDSTATDNSFLGGGIGYNWYYSTTADNDAGATKTVCTVSCNIFVNFATRDFTLVGPLASAGVTLASPYTVDRNGITRGADGVWDRGALEYH
jgi:hypothetical protein